MSLPIVKLVSDKPGRGTLTVNGFQIPGLAEVAFELGAGKNSVCKIKIVCESVEVSALTDEIEFVAIPKHAEQPETPTKLAVPIGDQNCKHENVLTHPGGTIECADCGEPLVAERVGL